MITKNSQGQDISAGFISALTSTDRTYDAKLYCDGTELQCSITNISVEKGSCGNEGAFAIGNVVGSTLTAQVRELTTLVKGKEVEARIGVSVNGSYEYVTLGHFVVTETQQTIYSTTLTAYGSTITRTGGAFVVPQTQTLANIASSISASATALAGRTVNVTFDSGITTSDVITASMNNLTAYQALQILASVVGGYAIDTYDGHIRICRFSDTPTLSRNNDTMLSLPSVEQENFEISGVLCIVSEEAEDEEGGIIPAVQFPAVPTGNENLIVQNQYMTQSLFVSYLDTLTGYEYRPAEIGLTYGDPRLEGNDVVSVTDINGSVYIIPCHMLTHTYTGGFATSVTAVKATEQENDVATSATSLTEQLSGIGASAITARASAESAKTSASEAYGYAQQANGYAQEALGYANEAQTKAQEATDYAQEANDNAQTASQYASDAYTFAQNAEQNAGDALTFAQSANSSATGALNSLGEVEKVIDALNWISEHGEYALTEDTEVQDGKWYFTESGGEYALVESPTGDPSAQGWYELSSVDSAISNYVSSHLALTSEGLSLQTDGTNTRLLLSAEEGLIIKGLGGQTLASYGQDAVIGDKYGFHITITPNYNSTGQGRLSFYKDETTEVAYVSGDKLYITQSVVLQQMDVGETVANGGLGQWSWKIHPINGKNNLYLKWNG